MKWVLIWFVISGTHSQEFETKVLCEFAMGEILAMVPSKAGCYPLTSDVTTEVEPPRP